MSGALNNQNVVITGATGGIGRLVCDGLAREGARLYLLAHSQSSLDAQLNKLAPATDADGSIGDFQDLDAPRAMVKQALTHFDGRVDMLINCAGMMRFSPFEQNEDSQISDLIAVNLTAPLLLIKHILPVMKSRGTGRIVNIGSTFGSIGFGFFSAYSASKFGLRGFSEALRRELDGSGITVTFIAPRRGQDTLNTTEVYAFAEKTKMNMDSPEWVAQRIVAAIIQNKKDVYLGFPEKLFARLNGFLPRLIDMGLRGQMKQAKALFSQMRDKH